MRLLKNRSKAELIDVADKEGISLSGSSSKEGEEPTKMDIVWAIRDKWNGLNLFAQMNKYRQYQ
jgi:hypothetical protein